LHLPNVSSVVPAFWTLNSDSRKRAQLLLFLTDHGDKLLRIVLDNDLPDFGFNLLG
jgi:hypothetical protein